MSDLRVAAAPVEVMAHLYRWAWTKLPRRQHMRCRVVCRGTMNSALVEFEDGYQVVTSRNGLRRADEEGP